MARIFIVVKFSVEALHNWPDARQKIPAMGFLADIHRHNFFFKATVPVSHSDRDIEIIQLKREMIDYFKRNYFNEDLNICNFGPRSCETLAQDLLEAYNCEEVECLEDNECGAVVKR